MASACTVCSRQPEKFVIAFNALKELFGLIGASRTREPAAGATTSDRYCRNNNLAAVFAKDSVLLPRDLCSSVGRQPRNKRGYDDHSHSDRRSGCSRWRD